MVHYYNIFDIETLFCPLKLGAGVGYDYKPELKLDIIMASKLN